MVQYASTGYLFQSTLPLRGVTAGAFDERLHRFISIHALREESDPSTCVIRSPTRYDFNPRSP